MLFKLFSGLEREESLPYFLYKGILILLPKSDKAHRKTMTKYKHKYKHLLDFPGGAVVKNPPANAGDTGSSPGPGRSHMLRSN